MSHVQVRSQNGYDWDVKMIKGEKNISVLNVIYYIIYYIDMNNNGSLLARLLWPSWSEAQH